MTTRNRTIYRFDFYIDKQGEHRWRLKARNGKIVADCAEGYSSTSKVRKAADKLSSAFLMPPVLSSAD